jgi:hypothetical protein
LEVDHLDDGLKALVVVGITECGVGDGHNNRFDRVGKAESLWREVLTVAVGGEMDWEGAHHVAVVGGSCIILVKCFEIGEGILDLVDVEVIGDFGSRSSNNIMIVEGVTWAQVVSNFDEGKDVL